MSEHGAGIDDPAWSRFHSSAEIVEAFRAAYSPLVVRMEELDPIADTLPDVYMVNALDIMGQVRWLSDAYARTMAEYAAHTNHDGITHSDRRIAMLVRVTNKTVGRWKNDPLPASALPVVPDRRP